MYHAISGDVLKYLKKQSIPTSILATAIDKFGHITTSCYWADSGINDKLRVLDKYATSIFLITWYNCK